MWVYRMSGTFEGREADVGALWDAGATGVEERNGEVRAYFADRIDLPFDGQWDEEAERDWQEHWKKDLRPVHAGRITIIPPWLAGEVPVGQLPLLIEVGMAFGTGHHATTRMAVEALGELDFARIGPVVADGQRSARVLDVGTGSGVLAMAASLLGAPVAVGVDTDPITIPAAYDNATLNGFTGEGSIRRNPRTGGKVVFAQGTIDDAHFADIGAEAYDVIAANLYAELHDLLMPRYREVLTEGGRVVLTGILADKLPLVLGALEREGFTLDDTRLDGEWALVTATA